MDIRQFNIVMHQDAGRLFVIQIPFHTMTAYVVPRENVAQAKDIAGIHRPGVYVLFGNGKIYIGQTRNGLTRIEQHLQTKEFWTRAILFLADSLQFDLDTISGLERVGIERAMDHSPYEVMNKVIPNYEAKTMYADKMLNACYDDIERILYFLGIDIDKSSAKTVAPVAEVAEEPVEDDSISLDAIDTLTFKHIDSYEYKGVKHPVKRMTQAYVEIVEDLYAAYPDKMKASKYGNDIYIGKKNIGAPENRVHEIAKDVYLNTCRSNDEKLVRLKRFCKAVGIDLGTILLHIID